MFLEEGKMIYNKRTGENCLTIPEFDYKLEADSPIPLLSVKQSFPVSAWAEMLGYLRRYQWANQFDKIGAKTWYGNANKTQAWLDNPNRLGENHIGQVYGAALEPWELPELFDKLEAHEDDRGLIINFWRPEKFDKGSLRPCMYLHNFTIIEDTLHLTSKQRSCDLGLGMNFNSLQGWILPRMFAKCAGLKVGTFKHEITNLHIYEKHIPAIKELISRVPDDNSGVKFDINDWVTCFDDLVSGDWHSRDYFSIEGYKHQGKIEMEMTV